MRSKVQGVRSFFAFSAPKQIPGHLEIVSQEFIFLVNQEDLLK